MKRVIVIGLGYVGLTTAVAFAQRGKQVVGVEANPTTLNDLLVNHVRIVEDGLADALHEVRNSGRLAIGGNLPSLEDDDSVLVCVGTGLSPDGRPALDSLLRAIEQIGQRLADKTLVVVRSTVPIGTHRNLLLPVLRQCTLSPRLTYCPERTIQGIALKEIGSLPQIVAGIDAESICRASELFQSLTRDIVPVSSYELAELAKLANNCHTDMLYAFGNQLAFICDRLGLDIAELLHATNYNYPRPDLSRAGYVGGSCLTKDPYYILNDSALKDTRLDLIRAAREINEALPDYLTQRLFERLDAELTGRTKSPVVLLCGCAYKGSPETDDIRGAAAPILARLLVERGATVLAQDFVIPPDLLRTSIGEPVSWIEGISQADAIVILNNHPGYAMMSLETLASRSGEPPIIYDLWGVMAVNAKKAVPTVRYVRLGDGTH